jgi:hypothetical protein
MIGVILQRASVLFSVLGATGMLLGSCSGADHADAADTVDADVSEWTTSAEPELQIGVVDGDAHYLMHELVSAVTLPDGRIAALNAGSHELRVYDENGRLLSQTGRRGGGPGEFQRPRRVYLLGDTLAVFDGSSNRLSLHRLDGEFIGTLPLLHQRGRLQWDEWLYDMSWVDGPALGRGRAVVMRAIERLPAPDTSDGYRYVRVTPFGHLWVRQPAPVDAATRRWHVYDLTGTQIASVEVPAELEIYDVGPDYLLGRVRDSLGVEYLRRYGLDTRGAVLTHYTFVGDSAVQQSEVDSVAVTALRIALRTLAGAQEMYYADPANSYRYADDHRRLSDYEPPKDVEVRILAGHATGWTAVAMHRATRTMCGVAIGTTPPVGWTSGVVMCP